MTPSPAPPRSRGNVVDMLPRDARAHWIVYQSVDGGPWTRFKSLASGNEVAFEKTNGLPTPLAVSEVQAINVLPLGGSS